MAKKLEIVFAGKKNDKDVSRTITIDRPQEELSSKDAADLAAFLLSNNAIIVGDGVATRVAKIAYTDNNDTVLYKTDKPAAAK